jgi:hypothetical protein
VSHHALAPLPQDRLLRTEVALGTVRQLVPLEGMWGLNFAPIKEIDSDNFVIYQAVGDAQTGMAPARADDAEAELFQQDEVRPGEGRGRTVDWALKSWYNTSSVNSHREMQRALDALRGTGNITDGQSIDNLVANFNAKVIRDTIARRRRLEMRLNWLAMTSMVEGVLAYNDGKIKFSVNWGRPAGQHRFAPNSGLYNSTTHDPIDDIRRIQQDGRDKYGLLINEAYCSQKYLDSFYRSAKFAQLSGTAGASLQDLAYLLPGFGPGSAVSIVEERTGMKFTVIDEVYRNRAVGATTYTTTRWLPEDEVLFKPSNDQIEALDDTGVGFASTLTSPHPAGNWTPGWYEWEKDYGQDPWAYAVGNGIKAFPVFPWLKVTYNMKVVL